jgi:hypothetical protein
MVGFGHVSHIFDAAFLWDNSAAGGSHDLENEPKDLEEDDGAKDEYGGPHKKGLGYNDTKVLGSFQPGAGICFD